MAADGYDVDRKVSQDMSMIGSNTLNRKQSKHDISKGDYKMFGKLSKEQIMKGIKNLSKEEFDELMGSLAEMKGSVNENPNDTEEQIEEAKADVEEKGEAPDQTEADRVDESVAEQGEVEGEEDTQTAEDRIDESEGEQMAAADTQAEDNRDDIIKGLTDRLSAIEETMSQFAELKTKMEEFTAKQAESFGYKGQVPSAKKDMQDMSAAELKHQILSGD